MVPLVLRFVRDESAGALRRATVMEMNRTGLGLDDRDGTTDEDAGES